MKILMKRLYMTFAVLAMAVASSRAQSLAVQDVEASVGEEAELVVTLAGSTEMSALQFNLTLPEGVTFDATRVQLGDATDGHTLCIEPLASGSHLFVLYSEDQKTFADDELLRIPLSAGSEALTAEGQLTKVRTATVDAVSHTCADVPFNAEWKQSATAIFRLEEPQSHDSQMYDLIGRRVSYPTGGIYIQNNRKMYVKP